MTQRVGEQPLIIFHLSLRPAVEIDHRSRWRPFDLRHCEGAVNEIAKQDIEKSNQSNYGFSSSLRSYSIQINLVKQQQEMADFSVRRCTGKEQLKETKQVASQSATLSHEVYAFGTDRVCQCHLP
jgi:hypothetical protein